MYQININMSATNLTTLDYKLSKDEYKTLIDWRTGIALTTL